MLLVRRTGTGLGHDASVKKANQNKPHNNQGRTVVTLYQETSVNKVTAASSHSVDDHSFRNVMCVIGRISPGSIGKDSLMIETTVDIHCKMIYRSVNLEMWSHLA